MSQVRDLQPGDLVRLGGEGAVFIAAAPHYRHPHLMLVCWRLADGMVSFDALHPYQDVGELQEVQPGHRARRLEAAVRGRYLE